MGEGGLRGRALRAHCRLPDGRPQRDASRSPNPGLLVLSLRMRATQEIGLRCVRDRLAEGAEGPRDQIAGETAGRGVSVWPGAGEGGDRGSFQSFKAHHAEDTVDLGFSDFQSETQKGTILSSLKKKEHRVGGRLD